VWKFVLYGVDTQILWKHNAYKGKGKGKVHPRTGHEGSGGE